MPGFALPPDVKDLQKGAADFSGDLAKSLPLNASLGLNWSDAYIGNLFTGAPHHFGVGVSLGFTTIPMAGMKDIAGLMDSSGLPDMDKLIMPAYTAEARIGGIVLPFDVGFKFGYLNLDSLPLTSINVNYLLVGADIRYAVLEGDVLPKIIVGVGFNYLKGGVGYEIGSSQKFSYGSVNEIALSDPKINFEWGTKSLDFKAQISKSLLIVTPYLGLGLSYAWSNAGYKFDSKVNVNGHPVSAADIKEINDYLKSAGMETMGVSAGGISSIIEDSALGIRVFGGLSVNMAVFMIDLTGLYSFRDSNYGVSLGFRFQL
jgi:hypothetical protein